MTERITGIRRCLVEHLTKLGSCRNWDHITQQTGMFANTDWNKTWGIPLNTNKSNQRLSICLHESLLQIVIQQGNLVVTVMKDPRYETHVSIDFKNVHKIGWFRFHCAISSLTAEQVERMKKEFSCYTTSDGRIAVAGLANKHVKYLANAMHTVTK